MINLNLIVSCCDVDDSMMILQFLNEWMLLYTLKSLNKNITDQHISCHWSPPENIRKPVAWNGLMFWMDSKVINTDIRVTFCYFHC